MTPDEWTGADPADLPTRWRECDESDVCERCGRDVDLADADLCEACHGLVSASVTRGGDARAGSLHR